MMDGEIERFIKVWITAISCLCYCYYIAAKLPRGFLRLLSLLPVLYLFLILPLNLSSFHLGAPTAFFLVWLAPFKLLLFSFNQGPLYPPPNIFHFISIASLPIQLKPSKQATKSNNTLNITKDGCPPKFLMDKGGFETSTYEKVKVKPRLPVMCLKLLILVVIIHCYDYNETIHPYFMFFLYRSHIQLGLELVFALSVAPAQAIFGFEIEPQFNKPSLSTSLRDFWGHRWNLMVTSILRSTVHNPVRRISTCFMGPAWAVHAARLTTFLVSGLMHELIYYYLTRAPPTWEVTCFFVLHGVCTVLEVEAKKLLLRHGWQLHHMVSRLLTQGFMVVTSSWLCFPQLSRNGVGNKAIGECAVMANFVKSMLPKHLSNSVY